MKAYLDTSVINVLLFSEYSTKDKKRFPSAKETFDKIDDGVLHAIGDLCKHKFELIGLLTRMERLIYKRNFVLEDSTDQPHAIAAHIHSCDYLLTYDHHYDALKNQFHVVTPAALLKKLESPND